MVIQGLNNMHLDPKESLGLSGRMPVLHERTRSQDANYSRQSAMRLRAAAHTAVEKVTIMHATGMSKLRWN